jgi:DNA-binding beta-propeller fold protein YncE
MKLAMTTKFKRLWRAVLLATFFLGVLHEVSVAAIASSAFAFKVIADIPLPGRASRYDYQSYDPTRHLLFIAHMGDGKVTVFNTQSHSVRADITDLDDVHGVLALPELNNVYASATGRHQIVAIDKEKFSIDASIPGGHYPDGLAYAPTAQRLYVSDESGEAEIVIDTRTNHYVETIALDGEAGNSQYDAQSGHIFVNVQTKNDLVEIDPKSDKIIARHALLGADHNHGLLIDSSRRLSFVACEGNAKLLVVDMHTFNVLGSYAVGDDPDVLAFDAELSLLYVASESGVVSVFRINKNDVEKVWEQRVDSSAHTIAVDPETHRVYLPLKSVRGHPVLRIMQPSIGS